MDTPLRHPKIMEPAALAKVMSESRAQEHALGHVTMAERRKVVFTNGCYDILHPGHVDLLSRARALGHALVLALNTDASVRRLGKGADRPVNPLAARAYVAAHLAAVDWVTWFDEDTPLKLITLLRPQVLVKGGDWPVENIVGREVVEADGGLVVSLPFLPSLCDYSTTNVVEKIRGSNRMMKMS